MHTGFVPSPNVQHPSYGAVVAHELAPQNPELQIPPFVAIGGNSRWTRVSWHDMVTVCRAIGWQRPQSQNAGGRCAFSDRMAALELLELGFNRQRRGQAAQDHTDVLSKSVEMMTSRQLAAFDVDQEPRATARALWCKSFWPRCLLARRLVEAGVPFIEVDFGGWDNHQNIFATLKDNRLPVLGSGL